MGTAWCCAILMLLSTRDASTQWPGWRGLEAQGVGAAPVPLTWSQDANVKWRTPLPGSGHSSPVVAGDQVFVTAAAKTSGASAGRILAMKGLLATAGAVVLGMAVQGAFSGAGIGSLAIRALLAGVCLGGLLQIRAIEPHASSQGTHYLLWLQLFAVPAVALLPWAGILRNHWRLLPAVLLITAAVLMVWLRPNAAYYQLTMDNNHSWPTLAAFLVLLLPGIAFLISGLRPRTRRTEPVAGPPVRRLAISLAATAVGAILTLDALATSARLGPLGHTLFLQSMPLWPYFVAAVIGTVASFNAPQVIRYREALMPAALFLVVGAVSVLAYNRPKDVLTRSILCIDRTNGAIRWTCTGLKGPQDNTHSYNSPATPTPVIFQDRVCAWFGTPGLMCSDLAGKLLWTNTEAPFKDIHGVGASPVIADGKLIVLSGNPKAPYITALNVETGRCIWRTDLRPWTGIHGEHRTPLVVSVGGRTEILNWTIGHDELAAYDAADGTELWRWPVPIRRIGEAVASIIADGDRLYLCDKTTVLCARMASEPCVVWQTPVRGKGPNTASPVLCNGLLFTVADAGWASCLDAATGQLCWQQRITREALASPVAAGDRVYFPTKTGTTIVVACDRKFNRLAENILPGSVFASPAPVEGQFILRTTNALWCIEGPDTTP